MLSWISTNSFLAFKITMPDACMIMHELLCRQVASCITRRILHETCMNMQGIFPWGALRVGVAVIECHGNRPQFRGLTIKMSTGSPISGFADLRTSMVHP